MSALIHIVSEIDISNSGCSTHKFDMEEKDLFFNRTAVSTGKLCSATLNRSFVLITMCASQTTPSRPFLLLVAL